MELKKEDFFISLINKNYGKGFVFEGIDGFYIYSAGYEFISVIDANSVNNTLKSLTAKGYGAEVLDEI